jgi:phospholipase/carboxylesterase
LTAISNLFYQGPSLTQTSKALILLHGRGGTAHGMLTLTEQLGINHFYTVAPQAAHNTWYPYSFLEEERFNEPYLSSSVKAIKDLIDQIEIYIPKHQIFILGFSQGACLALETSSRFATKYGGIIAFTGGLIGQTIDVNNYQGNFENTKIFISNGDQDPHIPLIRSQKSKEVLKSLDADVTLKIYKGKSHSISKDEIEFVKENFFRV